MRNVTKAFVPHDVENASLSFAVKIFPIFRKYIARAIADFLLGLRYQGDA